MLGNKYSLFHLEEYCSCKFCRQTKFDCFLIKDIKKSHRKNRLFFFLNLLKLLVLLSGRLALNARNRTKFKFRSYFSQFIVSISFDFHFIPHSMSVSLHIKFLRTKPRTKQTDRKGKEENMFST